jgi:sugar lactone lactonase YvrE
MGERQPDGICADAEGAVWVACFNTGEFVRVLVGGEVTDHFQFEGRGVSCTLGGFDGRQLFLSTYLGPSECIAAGDRRGALFTAKVDVPTSGF